MLPSLFAVGPLQVAFVALAVAVGLAFIVNINESPELLQVV